MDNKELLLECAKDLFYAKGYDAVGVQEIVDRAGLTKPTIYYYFGSKSGLLQTMFQIKCDAFSKALADFNKENKGICESLYELAELYCQFFEQDRKFYLLLMSMFYSARENEAYKIVEPYVLEFYQFVVQLFEHASHELGNMRGRQKQFATGFTGTINTYFLSVCQGETLKSEVNTKEQVKMLVDQFMYGIFS